MIHVNGKVIGGGGIYIWELEAINAAPGGDTGVSLWFLYMV